MNTRSYKRWWKDVQPYLMKPLHLQYINDGIYKHRLKKKSICRKFPSEDEGDTGSYDVFYPSQESSLGAAVECPSLLIETSSRTATQLDSAVEKNGDSEKAELKKISQL